MQLICGVDWAEAHHDVALVDMDGAVVARSRIDTGASGFNDLLALIAEHGGSAQDMPIALETDKNLLVVDLAEAGFAVQPARGGPLSGTLRSGRPQIRPRMPRYFRTSSALTDTCTARCRA